MKFPPQSKQLLYIFLFYFFIAWSLVGVYFLTHIQHVPDGWATWHQQIADGQQPDSTQFRLLSFWMADGISRLMAVPTYIAYLTIRLLMTFLLLCLFHMFLVSWFRPSIALLGTVILAVIQPITFLPFLQESDVVLYPFFLLGIWAIRDYKYWWLTLIIGAGCFAKETIVLLVPLYGLYHWPAAGRWWRIDWRQAGRRTAQVGGLLAVWGLIFFLTRHGFYDGANSAFWQYSKNLHSWSMGLRLNPLISVYLYFIPFLGMLWALPFIRLKEKPIFLRRTAPYMVIFFLITALMGWPHETRLLVPLALVAIPASIAALFPEEIKKTAAQMHATVEE